MKGFAVLGTVLLYGLLAAAVATAWWFRGTVTAQLWDNLHWTLSYGAAALLAWWGMPRAAPRSPDRAVRLGFAWGLGASALGQIAWNLQTWAGWLPFPAPSDVLFLVLGPSLIVGLIRGWTRRAGSPPPWSTYLDAATLTLGLLLLILGFYLPNRGEFSVFQLTVMVAYPVFSLGAASLLLVFALHEDRSQRRSPLVVSALLLANAALWMNWNLQFLQGTLSEGALTNGLFSFLIVTLALASQRWTWPAPSGNARPSAALILLPLFGLVAAGVGIVLQLMAPVRSEPSRWVLWGGAAVVLVLAAVRQGQIVRTLRDARETEAALQRLRQAQDQLIKSEKLAALGQLIAGVAHELNTPLAAIRSSSTTLLELVSWAVTSFPETWEVLTPASRQVALRLLHERDRIAVPWEHAERRQAKKTLAQELEQAGLSHADELAEHLLETGLGRDPELYRPLLAEPQLPQLVSLLDPFITALRLSEVLVQATDKAATVVSALRNYLHTGDNEEKAPCDVAENITAVFPLVRHRLRNDIDFSSDLQPGLVVRAWGDRLSQVWINLLTNALHALETAPPGPRVLSITARAEGPHAVIEVMDNGPGIPTALREKVFEPFFTTKPKGEGTGLGLGVCQSILQEVGGQLALSSEPGRTTFTVRIPLVPTAPS